jgi:hypothetical protein
MRDSLIVACLHKPSTTFLSLRFYDEDALHMMADLDERQQAKSLTDYRLGWNSEIDPNKRGWGQVFRRQPDHARFLAQSRLVSSNRVR